MPWGQQDARNWYSERAISGKSAEGENGGREWNAAPSGTYSAERPRTFNGIRAGERRRNSDIRREPPKRALRANYVEGGTEHNKLVDWMRWARTTTRRRLAAEQATIPRRFNGGGSRGQSSRHWRRRTNNEPTKDKHPATRRLEATRYTRLYSLRLCCRIVSFTAANTKRMFSVSETHTVGRNWE